MQNQGAMRIGHAFGLARGSRRVAESGRGVLVEIRISGSATALRQERLVIFVFGGRGDPQNGTTNTRSKRILSANFSYIGRSTSSTMSQRSCAWLAIKASSSGCKRRLSVCTTPPTAGIPKYASRCAEWFHIRVATRSPCLSPACCRLAARARARRCRSE